jgi:hypothetical protein
MTHRHPIPEKQRAFVFAGGGSLGAYAAGAYKAIYEFVKKRDEAQGVSGKPVFHEIIYNRC